MTNRELLKEAIADAKAVKEVAITNAKAALEEAFTPHLKSLLEQKLSEMEGEDETHMEEAKHEDADSMEEINLEELLRELEDESEEETEEMPDGEVETEEEEEIDFDNMTAEDLEAFIASVVDEMIEAGELEAGPGSEETPEMDMDMDTEEAPEEETMMENKQPVNEIVMTTALMAAGAALASIFGAGYLKAKADERNEISEKTAELIKAGKSPEEAAKEAYNAVKGAGSKAYGAQYGDKGKAAGSAGSAMTEGAEDEIAKALNDLHEDPSLDSEEEVKKALADLKTKVNEGAKLEEGLINEAYGAFLPVLKLIALKFGIGMGGATVVAGLIPVAAIATGAVTVAMIKKAVDKYKEQKANNELEEALKTVKILKSELNEVNLLNSKLLYTNKIFKAKNLSEAQKVQVLAAFDNAETVKETKLVYETLSAGLNKSSKKELVRENKSFASKTISGTSKQPVVETNAMIERFQKLAGLK